MRWRVLQHVPFEGPGYLASWIASRGHEMSSTRLWEGDRMPGLDEFDGLAVLGGPMNVYEDERFPWLESERELLREAADAGKAVVGICLGAQLLSVALGGNVDRSPHKEIGWHPVTLAAGVAERGLFDGFPDEFAAFHWHGDRFSIPPGARRLAASEGCQNQAFVYGARAAGLQFHLESTASGIERLLKHCAEDMTPGRYVQDEASIRQQNGRLREAHRLMAKLLDALTASPGGLTG